MKRGDNGISTQVTNVPLTLEKDTDNEGGMHMLEKEVYGKSLYLLLYFAVSLKVF
jgi:hypothetical protein